MMFRNERKITLKYFGSESLLDKTLSEAKLNFNGEFDYSYKAKYSDYTVYINLSSDEKKDTDDAVRNIVERLKDGIYAEYDGEPSEVLFEMLKLSKMTISTAESFTGGRIVSSIINNVGASQFVIEGIVCYSNESKISRLGVNKSDLESEGAVSSIVAYQMALGLLNGEKPDMAIATTGLAGPESDGSKKPVGLCYIAVGTRKGIHVYKFNFNGNREDITETAKNAALFLAIKNIQRG